MLSTKQKHGLAQIGPGQAALGLRVNLVEDTPRNVHDVFLFKLKHRLHPAPVSACKVGTGQTITTIAIKGIPCPLQTQGLRTELRLQWNAG